MSNKPQFDQPLVPLRLTGLHVREALDGLDRVRRDIEYEVDCETEFSAREDMLSAPGKIAAALSILRLLRDGLEAQERQDAKDTNPPDSE